MAIRIRKINGTTVALCAACTHAKEGDIYLDDSVHHALSTKFGVDWVSEGRLEKDLADENVKRLMIETEKPPTLSH
ncbi:MAG: hypothetical protein ABIJ12_13720 [bacterium]